MAEAQILVNDDERVAFAARLGWDVQPSAQDPADHERAATDYFQLDVLAGRGLEAELEGIDQRTLDEVRDAVIRRHRQTMVPEA